MTFRPLASHRLAPKLRLASGLRRLEDRLVSAIKLGRLLLPAMALETLSTLRATRTARLDPLNEPDAQATLTSRRAETSRLAIALHTQGGRIDPSTTRRTVMREQVGQLTTSALRGTGRSRSGRSLSGLESGSLVNKEVRPKAS